jgi:F-type H+-transporting ATPase subunit b
MRHLLLVAFLAIPVLAQEHDPKAAHKSGSHETGGHDESLGMWKWANFAILAALIGYGAAKAAPAFFRGRSDEILKSIREAREARDEAEARAAAIEKKLSRIGDEIDAVRASSRQEMESEGRRIQEETRRLVAKLQENASSEIAAMGKQAEADLRRHALDLALQLAEQKVKQRLTPTTQSSLVNRFVQGLRGGGVN